MKNFDCTLDAVNNLLNKYGGDAVIDGFIPGCLCDSLLIALPQGVLACREAYLNEWQSYYKCKFARTKRDISILYKHWNDDVDRFIEENQSLAEEAF